MLRSPLLRRAVSFRAAAIALLVFVVLAGGAYAASNTVPTSNAGDGSGVISGYTVSNIHYDLRPANPRRIRRVTFDLSPAPVAGSTIQVKLRAAAAAPWFPCTFSGAAVTCNIPNTAQGTVLGANRLRVVAAQ
jgi:hypothetical protein